MLATDGQEMVARRRDCDQVGVVTRDKRRFGGLAMAGSMGPHIANSSCQR
jgi:hypothetical protein